MKIKSIKKTLLVLPLFYLNSICGCKEKVSISTENKSISEIVSGTYSGDGKYMPFLSVPLDLPSGSTSCYLPNWAIYLKTGTASATISSINDSMVNIILTGSIFINEFNQNFILFKNGNLVSDTRGTIKFFIDSKSMQLSFQYPSTALIVADCIPKSIYYFVRKSSTLRYYCYANQTWEMNGTK